MSPVPRTQSSLVVEAGFLDTLATELGGIRQTLLQYDHSDVSYSELVRAVEEAIPDSSSRQRLLDRLGRFEKCIVFPELPPSDLGPTLKLDETRQLQLAAAMRIREIRQEQLRAAADAAKERVRQTAEGYNRPQGASEAQATSSGRRDATAPNGDADARPDEGESGTTTSALTTPSEQEIQQVMDASGCLLAATWDVGADWKRGLHNRIELGHDCAIAVASVLGSVSLATFLYQTFIDGGGPAWKAAVVWAIIIECLIVGAWIKASDDQTGNGAVICVNLVLGIIWVENRE